MWRKEQEEDDDHLVIGSSQGFVIGYDAKNIESVDFSCTLRYAYPAHEKSIRCIAGSYPTVATASADESIKVYQLDQLQELETLYEYDAPVFAVDMLPQVGLLSGGEDGQVLYYRYGQWSKPKRWKGHVRSVHSVSLHPSGKIGLTVARDKSLKLWKTNGECVTSLELGEEAFTVQWIQDGSGWLIATQNSFSVHSLQNGLVQEWKYPTRLVCICALSDSIFVVGGMDGYVRLYKIGENKPIQTYQVEGGCFVKGVGVGKQGFIYSLTSKGVIQARNMQGVYKWIEQVPTSYRPTAFHVATKS
ncbi:hypothetical protein GAYE_SCF04G2513 [Galdieria yellowstonensis]|uniref:Transducin family protein / WD-40 repeat family protein n=1 Tax=Galdieria yellowstonensis TaxID=3028027 RepID=A0AAV9IBA8_9RHOD|nr:hypothetical protein GAYE_SCF04G2513 [Galdieria yellowstonensis]